MHKKSSCWGTVTQTHTHMHVRVIIQCQRYWVETWKSLFLPATHTRAHTKTRGGHDCQVRASFMQQSRKCERRHTGAQTKQMIMLMCWQYANSMRVCVYFAMLCMTCHTGRRLNIFATCLFLAYFHHRWPALCSSSNKIHENIWRTHMSWHNLKANAPQAFCFSKKKLQISIKSLNSIFDCVNKPNHARLSPRRLCNVF